MSAHPSIDLPAPPPARAPIAREWRSPLSRAEYDRMVARGVLDDERVELLRGELVRVSPQGPRHSHVVTRLVELLLPALLGRAQVRPQCPLAASDDSEPEPDVAVVPPGAYLDDHPAEAFLVIEVAHTSLADDRGIKAEIYAAAGVAEYWIVNVAERVIEVHRDAREGRYRDRSTRGRDDRLALLAFPDVEIAVADVFR